MDPVLVTGSSGFLGRHAARHLAERGLPVVTLARKSSRPMGLGSVAGDLRSPDLVPLLANRPWGAIVHCAARLPTSFFGEDAEVAARDNRRIDANICEVAERAGAKLIYLSGTSLYGFNSGDSRLDEFSPLAPVGPYLAAKADMERHCMTRLGQGVTILRISAPYGPGQRPTVMTAFISRAVRGEPLTIYGEGSRTQVFTEVDDCSRAIECAIRHPGAAGIFNIAGEPPISMLGLARLIVSTLGSDSRVDRVVQADPQENYRANYSTDRAQALLHWTPIIPLELGIRRLAGSIQSE